MDPGPRPGFILSAALEARRSCTPTPTHSRSGRTAARWEAVEKIQKCDFFAPNASTRATIGQLAVQVNDL
jgi:hypothetical protein